MRNLYERDRLSKLEKKELDFKEKKNFKVKLGSWMNMNYVMTINKSDDETKKVFLNAKCRCENNKNKKKKQKVR